MKTLVSVVMLVLFVIPVFAGWSVTFLNSNGANATAANSISSDGQVAGFAELNSGYHARLWKPSTDSWVDLSPFLSNSSTVLGISNNQQVGAVQGMAWMWTGSAGGINLQPLDKAYGSCAYGVDNGEQVGCCVVLNDSRTAFAYHAWIWHGTAASGKDINPPGATGSAAYAISAGQEVGSAVISNHINAALWRSDTPESFINLNPAGVYYSTALGVDGGQQVGFIYGLNAQYGFYLPNASLWNGSAGSWVNLQPPGVYYSYAKGVSGGYQVGCAFYFDEYGYLFPHAKMWNGTAESIVDLHSLLPTDYIYSVANAVKTTTTQISIAGYAGKSPYDCRAIVWTYQFPITVQSNPPKIGIIRPCPLSH